MTLRLLGYSDRLTVAPGDTIRFMVSCDHPEYESRLVRLIHGDTNPEGPGFKQVEIASGMDGRRTGKHEDIHRVRTSRSRCPTTRFRASFTFAVFAYPTLPGPRRAGRSRSARAGRSGSTRWARSTITIGRRCIPRARRSHATPGTCSRSRWTTTEAGRMLSSSGRWRRSRTTNRLAIRGFELMMPVAAGQRGRSCSPATSPRAGRRAATSTASSIGRGCSRGRSTGGAQPACGARRTTWRRSAATRGRVGLRGRHPDRRCHRRAPATATTGGR